jgi:hypothetical protein
MQTAGDFNLRGDVARAETYLIGMSTKSYRMFGGGRRELLEDFGNPTRSSPSHPVLWSLERFDENDRLVEDIDVRRPEDQEAYRHLSAYDDFSRLVELSGFNERGTPLARFTFSYDALGKKTAAERWSPDGALLSRDEFDTHENLIRTHWFREGVVQKEECHRYEYSVEGTRLEQVYFPPERTVEGMVAPVLYPAFEVSELPRPLSYRSVSIRDARGRLREKLRYDADGSLLEQVVYDESGLILREYWSSGSSSTTTLFDGSNRPVEIRSSASPTFSGGRVVDDLTRFTYDVRGNLSEMITTGADGSVLYRTTNVYEYDHRGNWVRQAEVEQNLAWKREPPTSFETSREFKRTILYYPSDKHW